MYEFNPENDTEMGPLPIETRWTSDELKQTVEMLIKEFEVPREKDN